MAAWQNFKVAWVLLLLILTGSCKPSTTVVTPEKEVENVTVIPDQILSDISNHPIGINLDYLMDDDAFLNPRRKLVDALKAMGVKYLRYPGGNKSDFYMFSKPPYEESIPTLARTGIHAVHGRNKALNSDATDFNRPVLDFDEFMAICTEIGAEPVIVVAADEYLVDYPEGSTWSTKEELLDHAAAWVHYANIKNQYKIKYWMIANESWHDENTNSSAAIYAQDVVDFSKAMKAIDPSIWIIPNGDNDEWFKKVITVAGDYIDAVCISNYSRSWCDDKSGSLILPIERTIGAVEKYASKELPIIIAEYGPFSWCKGEESTIVNNMDNNFVNFEMTGLQLSVPQIEFSCFWNTRWIDDGGGKSNGFDALDKNGEFYPNGYGLMIWGNYLGTRMVATESSNSLLSFASYDPEKKKLFVYLANKSTDSVTVSLNVVGYMIKERAESMELLGKNALDQAPIWQESTSGENINELSVKGMSIQVSGYHLE